MAIMKETGIRRYIGVKGASLDIKGDRKSMANRMGAVMFRLLFASMMEDKRREFQILNDSDIDWTMIRLPFVVEGKLTGRTKVDECNMPGLKMRNADIAQFLVTQINDTTLIRKSPFICN
nr:NAD(P)H-binding protein [Paenibacillus sp. 481]